MKILKTSDLSEIFSEAKIAKGKNERIVVITNTNINEIYWEAPKQGFIICNTTNEYTSRLTVQHNNANILLIDPDIVGDLAIKQLIEEFENAVFEGGRHQKRLDLLKEL